MHRLSALFRPSSLRAAALALTLAPGLGLAGTAAAPGAPAATSTEPAPLTVTLQPAQRLALGVQVRPVLAESAASVQVFPGTLRVPSDRERVIAAPVAGRLEQLSVTVGDPVRAGQVLARLRSVEGAQLQRDLRQAQSQADLAARSLARDELLLAEGLIPAARAEASRAAQLQAQAQAEERQRALAQAGIKPEGPAEFSLSSPIAGVVLELPARVGQRLEPAEVLMRVADLGRLWLDLAVPAAQADALRVGDPVRLPGAGLGGKLVQIGRVVDPATQAVTVRAELRPGAAGGGPGLRPGQLVEAELEQPGPGLVQVEATAVLRHGGRAVVFVEEAAGRFRLQPVEPVGGARGTRRAVRGLAPGSAVVVQGTAALLALLP